MNLLTLIFFLINVSLILWLRKRYIFLIPLINIFADSYLLLTKEYGIFSLGNVRALMLMIFIGLYFLNSRQKLKKIDINIIIFLLYVILTAVFNSPDFSYSLVYAVKLATIFMLFIVAHNFFRRIEQLPSLNTIVFYSILFTIANIIIAQVFRIGVSEYLNESFYEGDGGVPTLFLGFGILLLPLITFNRKPVFSWKIAVPLLYALAIIFILLSMRRLSILSFFAGLTYQILLLKKGQSLTRMFIPVIILVVAASPVFYLTFMNRLEKRIETSEIVEEGRYKESMIVKNELTEGSLGDILFGFGFDNGINYYIDLTGEAQRGFHTFYSILIHNFGLFGFILFILIIYQITKKILLLTRKRPPGTFNRVARTVGISLIVSYLIQITSFGLDFISVNSLIFLYLGGLIGILGNAGKKVVVEK